MLTESATQALSILRDASLFQWYVIPLFALVVYVYSVEIERPLLRGGHQLGPYAPASPTLRHDQAPEFSKAVGLHPYCAVYVDPADHLSIRGLGDQHPVSRCFQHPRQSNRGFGAVVRVAEFGCEPADCPRVAGNRHPDEKF